MTDAHCHISEENASVREILIGRDFFGIHPWKTNQLELDALTSFCSQLPEVLGDDESLGVGEIGLDRLLDRNISPMMRKAFEQQLEIAAKMNRPVLLHGAKCWGEVVKTVQAARLRHSNWQRPVIFHGFSRSDGLIPTIVSLNGMISVGPSILNDHAVNYRRMVKKIPLERLLIETDRDQPGGPTIVEIAECLAHVLGMSFGELEAVTDRNADMI